MSGVAILALLRRIPWQAWALAGVLLALWGYGVHERHVGAAGVQAKFDAHLAADKADHDKAVAAAKAKEAADKAAFQAITDSYKKELANAQRNAARTIADLRAGTIRLRDRWTCPGVPQAAGPAAGVDAATADRQDSAGRAIAAGDSADAQIRGLQALLRAERGQVERN